MCSGGLATSSTGAGPSEGNTMLNNPYGLDTREEIEFFQMRNALAVAHTPTKDDVDLARVRDRNANPHNDSYKPRLRDEAELHSDIRFRYADRVLYHQYGKPYLSWLTKNFVLDGDKGVWRAQLNQSSFDNVRGVA